MRKNRFLLNLIAATAIGLSVFGCDSSSSGAVADTSDITVGANQNIVNEALFLREYMIVAQRGITTFAPAVDANQSLPPGATATIAGSGDAAIDDGRALLFELIGIGSTGSTTPDAQILGPGGENADGNAPTVDAANGHTTGYHVMEADPSGTFAIGISRARARGGTNDPSPEINQTQIQIYRLGIDQPLDVQFPPNIVFEDTANNLPIRFFDQDPISQGEFVAGSWSATGREFYASINGTVLTYIVNLSTGALDLQQTLSFPAGTSGRNNAVKFLQLANGSFVYAIDNANDQILRWDRDVTTGLLSNVTTFPTVDDPQGGTIDRSGNFMYITGRDSGLLAAYRIGTDGGLTAIPVQQGGISAPLDLTVRLGDIASNPQSDQVVLATYDGLLLPFTTDPTTGALISVGPGQGLVNNATNTGNIEIDATGRFVLAAQEAGLEDLAGLQLANLNPDTNGTNSGNAVFTTNTANATDAQGRLVYALNQAVDAFPNGSVQAYRIEADSSLTFVSSVSAENPYGISFFQKVLTPPAGTTTTTTNN